MAIREKKEGGVLLAIVSIRAGGKGAYLFRKGEFPFPHVGGRGKGEGAERELNRWLPVKGDTVRGKEESRTQQIAAFRGMCLGGGGGGDGTKGGKPLRNEPRNKREKEKRSYTI